MGKKTPNRCCKRDIIRYPFWLVSLIRMLLLIQPLYTLYQCRLSLTNQQQGIYKNYIHKMTFFDIMITLILSIGQSIWSWYQKLHLVFFKFQTWWNQTVKCKETQNYTKPVMVPNHSSNIWPVLDGYRGTPYAIAGMVCCCNTMYWFHTSKTQLACG